MKPSISFYTLGCRLNQSETAVMERGAQVRGLRVVDVGEPADVAVINTCTVTENGDADTRRLVYKINRLNPKARIALVGCQAQVQKAKLLELPNVRWVIGNAKKMEVAAIVADSGLWDAPEVIAPAIPRDNFTVPLAGIDRRHTRANIKIQDGCDFFCSFCEIPFARGRARSRRFEDIGLEARALVAAGHRELVITGINVGTYADGGHSLTDVINSLEDIEGLERIRISSIEPTTIPGKLLEKMARRGKLCRYLHVPLQSASNRVLKGMKRKYTLEEFDDFIRKAHALVSEICIGTDLIVGFPGENNSNFAVTARYLRESPIHYAHVFSYSQRRVAGSRKLAQKVSPAVIQKRSEILRDLSQRKRRMFYESLAGTRQRVLFEQKKRGAWSGLTDNYVRVCVHSGRALANHLAEVIVGAIDGQVVRAELEGPDE